MSRPCATSALARASTAKAFSSPIRSKAAIVRSMTALLPRGRHSRHGRDGTSSMRTCSSADQAGKIKRRQDLRRKRRSQLSPPKRPLMIAQELETDIRVGIIAEIDAAEIKRAGGKQVRSPMMCALNRRGCGSDLLVLARLGGSAGDAKAKATVKAAANTLSGSDDMADLHDMHDAGFISLSELRGAQSKWRQVDHISVSEYRDDSGVSRGQYSCCPTTCQTHVAIWSLEALSVPPLPGHVMSISDKRRAFRALHQSGCFVIPNPWNIGSARYLQGLGFKALATTSAGLRALAGLFGWRSSPAT